MNKIKELEPGMDNVEFRAIISQVTVGKTNGANKSNYLNLTLQDSTGILDAKMWSVEKEDIEAFVQGTVVEGKGDIIKYSGARQMKVIKMTAIEMTDEQKSAFLPKAPIDKDIMIKDIEDTIAGMKNEDYKTLTSALIEEHRDEFILFPAASRNHHEFISGLIYHTYCMLQLAKSAAKMYQSLDEDLLFAGVILHDIGKIRELSGPITPHYTVEGNLLGHISIGAMMISEKAKELGINDEHVQLLIHMILSHHGKNEYGSPVLPQLKEAEVLYLIDNIDARMNMFLKAEDQVEEGEYTKRIFALENRNVYKMKK